MKKELSPIEIIEMSELAQHAVLTCLMNSKRWKQGELAFQGGTCLHLIYGAPRFSQDMDFLVASERGLDAIMDRTAAAAAIQFGAGPDWTWRVSSRGVGEKDCRNPRIYHLTIQAPEWAKSIKIKVEFFVTRQECLAGYGINSAFTKPLLPPTTPFAQSLRVQTQGLVDAASIRELVADKVFAVASRPMVKARDWFDLWWVGQNIRGANVESMSSWSLAGWPLREQMYATERTREAMFESARQRIDDFQRSAHVKTIDINEWLRNHPNVQDKGAAVLQQASMLVSRVYDHMAVMHAKAMEKDQRILSRIQEIGFGVQTKKRATNVVGTRREGPIADMASHEADTMETSDGPASPIAEVWNELDVLSESMERSMKAARHAQQVAHRASQTIDPAHKREAPKMSGSNQLNELLFNSEQHASQMDGLFAPKERHALSIQRMKP